MGGVQRRVFELERHSFFKRAVTTLTHEQLLTLNSVPVDIVPAPGEGYFLLPIVTLLYAHIVVPYGNLYVVDEEPSGKIQIYYGANEFASLAAGSPGSGFGLRDVFVDRRITMFGPMFVAGTNREFGEVTVTNTQGELWHSSDVLNQPLTLFMYNGYGEMTLGDPANTLKCVSYYMTEKME